MLFALPKAVRFDFPGLTAPVLLEGVDYHGAAGACFLLDDIERSH
jgi:hypothetical protein